jgi:hypothetical protein
MLGLVVLPAALTLQTVHHPGWLEITSTNPTPLGYTTSLSLFVVGEALARHSKRTLEAFFGVQRP